MSKTNNKITMTQAELQALIKNAVAEALSQNSSNSADKKVTKKQTSPKVKNSAKPKTKSEALEAAYGSKEERSSWVKDQQTKGFALLKKKGFKYEVAYGKVVFASLKNQPAKVQSCFATKREYEKFRHDFRDQYYL